MDGRRWHRAVAVLLTITLIGTSACTSLRPIPLTSTATGAQVPAVKVGEHVQVTQVNGERHDFDITAIEADALLGENVRVSYEDIALLQVKRIDKGRTAILIGSIVGGILVYAAVQTLTAFSVLY